MTISTTTARTTYNGNGVTTVFPIPFRFLANGDIVVVSVSAAGVETTKALTTDYTLTGAGDDAGGTVTMLVAPANGTRLVIYRDTDIVQETDYISGDPFPAETHERALDRLTMIAQEIGAAADRAIKVPVGDSSSLSTTLPASANRLDKFLVFDIATGAAEMSSVTQTQVASAVAAAYSAGGSTADAVVFLPEGTGAVSRTVQEKLRESVSPNDRDATGDGVTNDRTALGNAVSDASVVNLVNDDTYVIDAGASPSFGVTLISDRTIQGTGQAALSNLTLNSTAITTDIEGGASNINIADVIARGNASNTNDWPAITMAGTTVGSVRGNYIDAGAYGIRTAYSTYNDRAERRSTAVRVSGNASTVSGTAFELFSLNTCSFVGNVAYKSGTMAVAHGIRVVGYGVAQSAPGTNLENYNCAVVGNAITNYSNGISQQAGVYGYAYAGNAISGCTIGIQMPTNMTDALDVSKGNVFAGTTISDCNVGIKMERSEKQVFSGFAIRGATYRSIDMLVGSSTSTYGTGKYNRFSGLVSDYDGVSEATYFECSNSRIDLTIADVVATGTTGIRIAGNFNIVTITGGGYESLTNQFIKLSGSNNIVTFAGDGILKTSGAISVTGDYNTVIAATDLATDPSYGQITVSGDYNRCVGAARTFSCTGTGNDYTGLVGGSNRSVVNTTTDGSGDVTVTHAMLPYATTSAYAVAVTMEGTTCRHATVHTKTATTFKVRVFDAAGAALATTSVQFSWVGQVFAN